MSIITLIEVLRGVSPRKREKVKHLLKQAYRILNIDNNVILKYCELYTLLKEKGQLIPDADLLVASTALANNLTLVTKDKDSKRLIKYGLKLELRA